MLRSMLEIRGYRIEAEAGELGKVADFYFDDHEWTVRYLVADTGKWLAERLVLVSPAVCGEPDRQARRLPVDLTREQIENAPRAARELPVSRQHEAELTSYYGWVPYWGAMTPTGVPAAPAVIATSPQEETAGEAEGDLHLRSAKEVEGYHIHALDGAIGHVQDFVLEGRIWRIRYLVVDTRNWLPGRKVLVSPDWVQKINWGDHAVSFDVCREYVQKSPVYDPAAPVNREYEVRLHDYYGRPEYWESDTEE